MSVFDSSPTTALVVRADQPLLDEAQLATAAFLARYNGRTLQFYRADLRQYLQWADTVGVAPLEATRPHIELYRAYMEARGLAASTIDRRLSTVCGYYRFAHLDGRIGSNPAQYVRRPPVHPAMQRGMDRGELASFLYTAERTSRSTQRWPSCSASTASRSAKPAAPTSRISGSNAVIAACRSSAKPTNRRPSRSSPAPPAPSTWLSAERTEGPILTPGRCRTAPPPGRRRREGARFRAGDRPPVGRVRRCGSPAAGRADPRLCVSACG